MFSEAIQNLCIFLFFPEYLVITLVYIDMLNENGQAAWLSG